MAKKIGVISDTHSLLRDEVKGRLAGCDRIIHAGDVGSAAVLTELQQIAEVVVVRGNVDTGAWAVGLPPEEYWEVEGHRIYVVHDLSACALDPAGAGIDIVIHGHSHRPGIVHQDGILYLNPGSAGPKRFHLPVSMAFLRIEAAAISPEMVVL